MFQRASNSTTPRLKTKPCFVSQIPQFFLNNNNSNSSSSSFTISCWLQGQLQILQPPQTVEVSDDSCDEVTVYYRIQDRTGSVFVTHIEELPRIEKSKNPIVLNDVCSISFSNNNVDEEDDDDDDIYEIKKEEDSDQNLKIKLENTKNNKKGKKSIAGTNNNNLCYCMAVGVILPCSLAPVLFAFQIRELTERPSASSSFHFPEIHVSALLLSSSNENQNQQPCRRQRNEEETQQEKEKEKLVIVENDELELIREFWAKKFTLEQRWDKFITNLYSTKKSQNNNR
jgi:hypothetical protein